MMVTMVTLLTVTTSAVAQWISDGHELGEPGLSSWCWSWST